MIVDSNHRCYKDPYIIVIDAKGEEKDIQKMQFKKCILNMPFCEKAVAGLHSSCVIISENEFDSKLWLPLEINLSLSLNKFLGTGK